MQTSHVHSDVGAERYETQNKINFMDADAVEPWTPTESGFCYRKSADSCRNQVSHLVKHERHNKA